MSQPESSNAMRYGSRYPSTSPSAATRTCPVCDGTPPSSRSVYCGPACKQLAYRLRHPQLSTVNTVIIRKQLQRQRLLVAHTVWECPSCGEQTLGERRCSECGLFGRSVGLGGNCPECDTVVLLADLLEQDLAAPS
jgi:ribosomal protein L32